MRDEAIRENIRRFQDTLTACEGYGDHVTLVAVSKTYPIADLHSARVAGLRVFGESRVQEARSKRPELAEDCRIHLIGSLQSNKVKYCPDLFDTIHSLSDIGLAKALDERYRRAGKTLDAFIQVNLSGEASKNGLSSFDEAQGFLEQTLTLEHLRIIGLMTMPDPEFTDPQTAKIFRGLASMREKLAMRYDLGDRLTKLSMGMSFDYKIALAEGSTHIRIGSALFGARNRRESKSP